jgi:hypothetical protein
MARQLTYPLSPGGSQPERRLSAEELEAIGSERPAPRSAPVLAPRRARAGAGRRPDGVLRRELRLMTAVRQLLRARGGRSALDI